MRRPIQFGAATVLALAVLSVPVSANADGDQPEAPITDEAIVSNVSQLTDAEVSDLEVTDPDRIAEILADSVEQGADDDLLTRPVTVYETDQGTTVVVTAGVEMNGVEGENAEGEPVTSLEPVAAAPDAAAEAGYVEPPTNGQFHYLHDDSMVTNVGTWQRKIWWTWMKANNVNGYDWWRGYYRMQASTLTGSSSTEGFKRAWMELDYIGGSSMTAFEDNKPNSSYAGPGDTDKTIGFGVTGGVSLGAPPEVASGSASLSYQGTIHQSSENWHPIIRTDGRTGGVQWCRYTSAEFVGSRMVTARVNVKGPTGTEAGVVPAYQIKQGQSDDTTNCGSQT